LPPGQVDGLRFFPARTLLTLDSICSRLHCQGFSFWLWLGLQATEKETKKEKRKIANHTLTIRFIIDLLNFS
jgi:hypothetical protein